MIVKTCTGCREESPVSNFPRDRRNRDGLNARCRPCVSAQNMAAARRYSDPANRVFVSEKRCPTCRETKPAASFHRSSRRKDGLHAYCKSCSTSRDRRQRYDVDFDALLESQGGGCASCGAVESLVVDHDHATGEVRGILCSSCNIGIGHFGDDPARLRAAAAYVEVSSGSLRA